MLVVDIVLYIVLTWYIEEVRPGKYGVAKPLYFPFMPSYWLGQRGRGMCTGRRGTLHVRLEEEEEAEKDGVEMAGVCVESGVVCNKSVWVNPRHL